MATLVVVASPDQASTSLPWHITIYNLRMTFPALRTLLASTAPLIGAAVLLLGSGVAWADDDPIPGPLLHSVKYTVYSETPFRNATIFYRAVDPPNFSDYSHDPYAFSPGAEADLGPNQQWTMNATLADPWAWAMVTVSSLDSPKKPNFHCVLVVDGQVVATSEGPRGAVCSLRNY